MTDWQAAYNSGTTAVIVLLRLVGLTQRQMEVGLLENVDLNNGSGVERLFSR